MASSNYVGARSIEELAAALNKFDYTPRTEAERRVQAENLYRTQLEQALRNAQQTYEESDTALANQLIGLDTGYNRQRQSQEEATRAAIAQADRHALSRGMQRSTYNNATLANLQNKGNEALARIEENRENDRASVENQRSQLFRNLARTREGANADFQSQVIAAMQQLENEDYNRRLTADTNNNNTQLQLYASRQAEDQFNQNLALKREQMAQEQKQFEDQMWFNRQKEGLGWSTAEDAKGNGTGVNGNPSNHEELMAAIRGAGTTGAAGVGSNAGTTGTSGTVGAAGRGDFRPGNGSELMSQYDILRNYIANNPNTDGAPPGYEDGYNKWLAEQEAARQAAAAGTRSTGGRQKIKPVTAVVPMTSTRDWSQKFGSNPQPSTAVTAGTLSSPIHGDDTDHLTPGQLKYGSNLPARYTKVTYTGVKR